MSVILTVYCLFALTVFLLRWLRRQRPSTLEQVRSVLAPRELSLDTHLLRRATANTRLARTFQLSNTFVSAERHTHKAFIADAHSLLQRWDVTTFPGTACALLDAYSDLLPLAIAYDSLTQLITFTLVAETLLGGHVPPGEWREVLRVARGINDLWEVSKKHPQLRIEDTKLRAEMDAHLDCWLPHLPHPLDFVIPAYETMWRVVAVLVGRVVGTPSASPLLAYLEDPQDSVFRLSSAGNPSAEALVKETLRLHSPVRRISRTTSSSRLSRALCASLPRWLQPTSICTADLDALHRDAAIWGSTANEFDALRFEPSRLTREQSEAWSPFGQGPLSCIAARDAPRLAALIAGAVLKRIDEGDWKLTRGPKLGARRGWEGWSVQISSSRVVSVDA